MALYRKNCMTLFVDINVIATYDINDINLEVDINVSLPLGTMLALKECISAKEDAANNYAGKGDLEIVDLSLTASVGWLSLASRTSSS